jgi:hypothetical protein
MKGYLLVIICLFYLSPTSAHWDEVDNHTHMLTPEEEELLYDSLDDGDFLKSFNLRFQFQQTLWDECDDEITGNFEDSSITLTCSNRRAISVILQSFLFNHLSKCVNTGLVSIGAPSARFIHISHMGITADPLHSPRSLHSERRAIDLRVLRVEFQNGQQAHFAYGDLAHHQFFENVRQCWGNSLIQFNQCPPFDGARNRTGSIGREDGNHQNHLHISVPYCINGNYAGNFFRR